MRRLSITLLVVLAAALAGCGRHPTNSGIASVSGATPGRTGAPSPTASVDRMQQALAYARCMRAHGVDMPDPVADNDGGIRITLGTKGKVDGSTQAKVQGAMNACKQYAPNGGNPPSMSPEDLAKARSFAACMRQHGFDMPDPDPNGGGGIRINNSRGPDDPTFKSAMQACQSLLPGKIK